MIRDLVFPFRRFVNRSSVCVGVSLVPLLILATDSCQSVAAAAGVEVVGGAELHYFSGSEQAVPVSFRNLASDPVTLPLRHRLFQSASGLLAPTGPAQEWKTVTIGPGQTVTDTVKLNLPSVRSAARFSLVWSTGDTKLGAVRLAAHPSGLLRGLAALAGEGAIGLIDPGARLAPALADVRFELLAEAEPIAAFEGKLLLVAPLAATNRIAGLAAALKRRATAGTGVVWLGHSGETDPALPGYIYVLEQGRGRVVVADGSVVENFAQSPAAQLRLVALAELASGQKKLALPEEPGDVRLSQQE